MKTALLLFALAYLASSGNLPPYQATAHHEQGFLEKRGNLPPYQATAHHEQSFLERRHVITQSHADMFAASRQNLERRGNMPSYQFNAHHEQGFLEKRGNMPSYQSIAHHDQGFLERRDFTPVAVGFAHTASGLERRDFTPVATGFAHTTSDLDRRGIPLTHVAAYHEPSFLDRRGIPLTHVAAYHEPSFLAKRAGDSKKKIPVKKAPKKKVPVNKKKAKKPSSLKKCMDTLRDQFEPFGSIHDAFDDYGHVLTMFAEQMIGDAQKNKEVGNDITLGLQSANTYLTMLRLQSADDHIAWRKGLMLNEVNWLQTKTRTAMHLVSKISPMPKLAWLGTVAKTPADGLNWLWAEKPTKEAKKKLKSMTRTEQKATKNLKAWIDSQLAELHKEQTKLTTTLCNRMLG